MGYPMSRKLKLYKTCLKCNRTLVDPESQKRGYGPVCASYDPALIQAELEAAGQLAFPKELLRPSRPVRLVR